LTVKNYYKLPKEERVQALHAIRDWLWHHPTHPAYLKALTALEICHNSLTIEEDQFTQEVIDKLT
jgi:hypothetical protein